MLLQQFEDRSKTILIVYVDIILTGEHSGNGNAKEKFSDEV